MPNFKWYPQFTGLVKDPEGKHYQKMGMAKWLFDFFCAASDRKTGEWAAPLSQIAEQTGIPLWTVKRYMKILKKGDYISVKRHSRGVVVKIAKYKTLVKPENGAPTLDDISKDDRMPLEKSLKSKLYVAPHQEMQEYFKKILNKSYLSNHDDYVLLQMYWDKIPLVVIKNTVEDILSRTDKKNIFTLRYFKKAIYENHKKYTHRLEPEKELMSQDAINQKEKFHKLAGNLAKEKKHEETEEII